MKKNSKQRKNESDDPIERCIVCGAETPYRFSTPISERNFYDIGAGQLCEKCHFELYVKKSAW